MESAPGLGLPLGSGGDVLEAPVEALGPEVEVGARAEADALDESDQGLGVAADRVDRLADDWRLPVAGQRDGD